jgi:hypothetical protein
LRHRDIHQYTATSETALTALNKWWEKRFVLSSYHLEKNYGH